MSEQTVPAPRYVEAMPITEIVESKHNPRKQFDPASLKELEQSIREKGVLTPLLLRPNGKGHEIAAGHRRFRAATAAGLEAVPAIVRPMTDAELLEVLVIENDQREDVHPLEEAAGYNALMTTAKYDVQRIADRIGRSAKYVYDRLKLLELVPKAQELFLAGKFTAGHAILLARLKPEDQKRAIDLEEPGNSYRLKGLFQVEHSELPFDENDRSAKKKDLYAEVKAVSVREFESWIHDSIRAEPKDIDPFLFPETAETLQAHAGDKLAAILITREYMAGDQVRHAGKERVYGVNAWKRADGQEKSKTCDRSRIGFVACGPGQGEAFLVCVNKEKCEVHYGAEIRARKKRQKQVAKGGEPAKKAKDDYAREEQKRKEEQARREAFRARYRKALPVLLDELAAKVQNADAGVKGPLARFVLPYENGYGEYPAPATEKLLEIGDSAQDLVRFAAFVRMRLSARSWQGPEELPKILKAFGLDYGKLLNAAAPVEKPKVQASAKPGICRKCGCTEQAACEGGCAWVDKEQTKCSACFPPKASAKKGGKR